MAASLRTLARFFCRKFSSTLSRAIPQAQPTKFVPGSKLEAFRETVRNVSCMTSSASAKEGCRALTNARIEFSWRTNSNYTSSVALGASLLSSGLVIASNDTAAAIVSKKRENKYHVLHGPVNPGSPSLKRDHRQPRAPIVRGHKGAVIIASTSFILRAFGFIGGRIFVSSGAHIDLEHGWLVTGVVCFALGPLGR